MNGIKYPKLKRMDTVVTTMRDLITIVEAATASGYLFHATRLNNLRGIQQHGLTPNNDREPTFDGYPVNGRLYVARTEDAASFYAETLVRDFGAKVAMLRFPSSVIHVRSDKYGNSGDYYTKNTVPPDVIELKKGNRWVPLDSVHLSREGQTDSTRPQFTLGPLSVFKVGNTLDVTNNARPKDKDNDNIVVRLVIDSNLVVDAATPRVREFKDVVVDLLNHLGMAAEGRAAVLLANHGIRHQEGRWTLDPAVAIPVARR